MDAFAVERYRYLLAALAIALLLGFVAAAFLARRFAAAQLDEDAGAATPPPTQVLPHVMLMLVAIVVATGAVLLLPAALVLRYFPGWPVRILVLSGVVLLLAPLAYAWRSRPF